MAGTIADLGEQSSYAFDRGVTRRFAETSQLLKRMPVKKIDGDSYKFRVQETLSGIQNRAVNEAYAESTGRLGSRQEDLTIMGGEFFWDKALKRFAKSGGDSIDMIAEQAEMKSTALAREMERQILEGDKLVNPKEMQGIRPRATGNQVILAGSGGATMTLAMVDALLDTVPEGIGERVFITNKAVRRKWTTLALAQSTIARISFSNINDLGRQIMNYDGVPIMIVEDSWDTSTILEAEDPGDGTSDTYSLYLVSLGIEEGVHMIVNGNGPLADCYRVTAETETGPPGEKWRIEVYPGFVQKHPRALGRLRGLLL